MKIKQFYNKYKSELILISKVIGFVIVATGNVLAWVKLREDNAVSNAIANQRDIEWRNRVDSLFVLSFNKLEVTDKKASDIIQKIDSLNLKIKDVEINQEAQYYMLSALDNSYTKLLSDLGKLDEITRYQKLIINMLRPESKVSIQKIPYR